MNSIDLIATPANAPWVHWTLFLLLVCVVIAAVFDSGIYTEIRKIFSLPERAYSDGSNRLLSKVLCAVFCVGTVSLALYVGCWRGVDMHLSTYFIIVGIVCGVLVVKQLLVGFLYAVFQFGPNRSMVSQRSVQFCMLGASLLYFILLFVTNYEIAAFPVIFGIVVCLYFLMNLQLLLRVYTSKLLSVFYILLYFVSLELLPFAGMVFGSLAVVEN